jgi:hypothetical protein
MRRATEICSQFYQRLRPSMLRIGSVCIQMCGNYGIEYSEKESDALPTSDRIVSCMSHIHCNEETVKLV